MSIEAHVIGAAGFEQALCEWCDMTFDWCLVLEVAYEDEDDDTMVPMLQFEPICFGCFRHPVNEQGENP